VISSAPGSTVARPSTSDSADLSYTPKPAPDSLTSQTELSSWQTLFRLRRAWANEVVGKCAAMTTKIQGRLDEIGVVEQATGVALANLENHVKSLEQKHVDASQWVQEVVRDQENTLKGWDRALQRLSLIPIKGSLLHFVSGIDPSGNTSPGAQKTASQTLATIVNTENVRKAGIAGPDISRDFQAQMGKISESVSSIADNTRQLVDRISRLSAESVVEMTEETSRLIEDVEAVARKIASDCDHVLELPANTKSVSQASKMALLHTKNYLPNIGETAIDIGRLLDQVNARKRNVADQAVSDLQQLSSIESRLANLNEQLANLNVEESGMRAFELLGLVQRLPLLYGSLLAEAVRRREWAEKVKIESSALAEDLAVLKEEEERRRKRWHKNTGVFIIPNASDATTMGVEISLHGEEKVWPPITRSDLDEFLDVIKNIQGTNDIVREMSETIKSLDRPSRAQTRRVKSTFKNGSVHEATLGRSSLLIRPDDDLLQKVHDEKAKLEDKLKGSESRIRKLEDLLHRQSQMGRASPTISFQPPLPYAPSNPSQLSQAIMAQSPRDQMSRTSSTATNPVVTPTLAEDRNLGQRIALLEAELVSEKDNVSKLESQIAARLNAEKDYLDQLRDADSAKRDLLANLDAQQIEHANERKLLEDDLQNHKMKIEELEDELDRIVGSRDKEKIDFEEEKRKVIDDFNSHKHSSQATLDALLADLAEQKTVSKRLYKQVEELLQEKRLRDEAETEHIKALNTAHLHLQLDPKSAAPKVFSALVEAVEGLAETSANKIMTLNLNLSNAKSDSEFAQRRVVDMTAEKAILNDKLVAEEMESFTMRESLAREKATIATLRQEIEEEKSQLASVRARISERETGSTALQDKLTEGENKIFALRESLSVEVAKCKTYEEELGEVRSKMKDLVKDNDQIISRYDARSMKAKELASKLLAVYQQLVQMADSLGFVISLKDDKIQFTRLSKSSGTASIITSGDLDPSTSVRSLVGNNIGQSLLGDLQSAGTLSWMQAESPNSENRDFVEFVDGVDKFDLEVFRDAVSKRMKDIEHVARKWQKEARGYRDRYHKAQMDEHQKIAFRSFKEGDLALFLPTRNQATRPWAAFNVGAPHYFLREQDAHKLRSRDWLLARITKVEERIVDLSKSLSHASNTANNGDHRSIGEASDSASIEDENPFELSDGLRWYMLDAVEETGGAPRTPGLAKTTVASAHVDAKGSLGVKKSVDQVSKSLSKSLASRRNSTNSRKDQTGERSPVVGSYGSGTGSGKGVASPTKPASERLSDFPVGPSAAGLGLSVPPRDGSFLSPSNQDVSFL
jgi:autophagy-related protein 11